MMWRTRSARAEAEAAHAHAELAASQLSASQLSPEQQKKYASSILQLSQLSSSGVGTMLPRSTSPPPSPPYPAWPCQCPAPA